MYPSLQPLLFISDIIYKDINEYKLNWNWIAIEKIFYKDYYSINLNLSQKIF